MRKLLEVTNAPRGHWVGDGFPVRSLFSHHSHGADVSPFLLFDYAGPAEFKPSDIPRGVEQHPHRGFETVTIVYQGEVEHRDSAGNSGAIGPGDVQWMTAASGVLHEEMHSDAFTRAGGTFEAVQLWVNLPASEKMSTPRYQTLLGRDIPTVELDDGAGRVRVIAGAFRGVKGAARTVTPVEMWDVRLNAGNSATFDAPDGHTLLVVALDGVVLVNGETIVRGAQAARFARTGGSITIEANGAAKLLILGGEPIDGPIVAHGPFVMTTQAEIRQAVADYNAGKFGRLD
ncbi:MAG: pirin family protein [Hyphomicrobium sp.]